MCPNRSEAIYSSLISGIIGILIGIAFTLLSQKILHSKSSIKAKYVHAKDNETELDTYDTVTEGIVST